jgi:hypothetical protein
MGACPQRTLNSHLPVEKRHEDTECHAEALNAHDGHLKVDLDSVRTCALADRELQTRLLLTSRHIM